MNKKFPEKTIVIPNAIDPMELEGIAIDNNNEPDIRKKFNIPNNAKIILFVGPIIERKGIVYLIKSINIILNEYKNDKLLFIFTGMGDYLTQCYQMAEYYRVRGHIVFTIYWRCQ